MAQELTRRGSERGSLRYQPGSIFGSLQQQMKRLLDDFTRGWPGFESLGPRSDFLPNIDVKDDKDSVHIDAELPGMSEKEIEVVVSGDC